MEHCSLDVTAVHIILASIMLVCFGSAIGAYVFRTPKHEEYQWKKEAHEFLDLEFQESESPPKSFFSGRSHCPNCQQTLSSIDLIPLLSFSINKKRCRHCKSPIPWFYFIIETTTLFLCLPLLWVANNEFEFLIISLIFCCLLTISLIDWQYQWIPDQLNLLLLGLALTYVLLGPLELLQSSILGMLVGYLFVTCIRQIYLSIRQVEAIGMGDAKLLSGLGAWQGLDALFIIIFVASTLGILYVLIYKKPRDQTIAFGPFLCAAAIIHFIINQLIFVPSY